MSETARADAASTADSAVRIALACGVAALLWRALPALVQAFWVDEAGTRWLVDGGWPELVARWRQWPYQSLAHSAVALAAKQLLGPSEWALRLPSVLAATGALLLFHRLARRLVGEVGAAAALLALFGCPSFHFALTTARPYGLGLLALVASWSALGVGGPVPRGRRLAAWAAASAAVAYCHYTLALGVAAQLPILVSRWRAGDRRERRALALAAAAIAVACQPLAGAVLATASQLPALDMFWESPSRLHPLAALSPTALGFQLVLVVAVGLACGAWPARATPAVAADAARVAAPLWLLPVAVTFAAHQLGVAALHHDRYQIAALPGLALAVGITVTTLPRPLARRLAVAALALAAPFTGVSRHWPLLDGADWRAASRASARLATADELVLTPSPFIESNHEAYFAELELPGRLSANLLVYPLAATAVVLPRDPVADTTAYAERRLAALGFAARPRFALLHVAQGPWLNWLLRRYPQFEPVRVSRWGTLQWIEFERRGGAPDDAAP